MSLYDEVIAALPELEGSQELRFGAIVLQNDSDGKGDYIAKWQYEKPIPESLKKYMR